MEVATEVVMFESAVVVMAQSKVVACEVVLRQNFTSLVVNPKVFTVPLRLAPPLTIDDAAEVVTAGAPGEITKDCSTGGAAVYVASPACVALMTHVPMACMTIFKELTVQTVGVSEARLTTNPLDDVADDANGVEEKLRSDGLLNVIVCGVFESIGKVCVTGVAAEKLAFPG